MKTLINSIYLATEGEGIHIGTPQIFVRFQGCAIGCLNCDSKDTWDFSETDNAFVNTVDEIVEEVSNLGGRGDIKRVSITGGDPLHPKHIPSLKLLVKKLKSKGYFINLEAAGTRIENEVFDSIDFISFDIKTPSTGVKTNLALVQKMYEQFNNKFQIKAVIENSHDFDFVLNTYMDLKNKVENISDNPWCLTPSYNLNEAFPQERFSQVFDWNMKSGAFFRVIGQQHKWIYGPDRKQI